MPMGEQAWKTSKGPRKTVTCRISKEAHLVLEVAAAQMGKSVTGLVPEIVERWAASWLDANRDELQQAVTAEKAARARGDA